MITKWFLCLYRVQIYHISPNIDCLWEGCHSMSCFSYLLFAIVFYFINKNALIKQRQILVFSWQYCLTAFEWSPTLSLWSCKSSTTSQTSKSFCQMIPSVSVWPWHQNWPIIVLGTYPFYSRYLITTSKPL